MGLPYRVAILDPEGDEVDAIEYREDGHRLSLLPPLSGTEANTVEAWVLRTIRQAAEDRRR